MFGLFAAFGTMMQDFSAERLRAIWGPVAKAKTFSNRSNVTMTHWVPENHPEKPAVYSSGDDMFHLVVDGYVITGSGRTTIGLSAQIDSLLDCFQKQGIPEGLGGLLAGSYVMTAVDMSSHKAYVITDPIGSIPVYIGETSKGLLVSTNPVALARTGVVDTTPDMTACAEWALFAYILGDRYPVRGIRTLGPGTILSMDLRSGKIHRQTCERFWEIPASGNTPPVEETAEAFRQACARLQRIAPCPANLQSAGMDSRLISASWPRGDEISCFTYGDPEAHEIRIARMVAEVRGARWTHTWQHGDEVAANADSIFHESGIIMWPDRRFVAGKIASENLSGVLDGLCGDVILGGSYYGHDKYFGWGKTAKRLFARPFDLGYSGISMDRIAEAMYDDILQVKDFGYLNGFLDGDFVLSLQRERGNILQDIRDSIQATRPGENSLALLWRNFLIANRASHYTVLQGVMCRRYLNVYYPFTNDREFARTAMNIHPKDSMYRRYYIRLYRRCHPRYAEIPYCDSLLPIRRPVLNHKLSSILLSKDLWIPHLTGSPHGRVRDPNGWAIWLRESGRLREYVRSCLSSAGLSDKTREDVYFRDIESGKTEGGGKLFHLASIAKWMTISKSLRQ